MEYRRRIPALFLAVIMLFSLAVPAWAEGETEEAEVPQVWCTNLWWENDIYDEEEPEEYSAFSGMNFSIGNWPRGGLYYGLENGEKQKVIAVSSSDENVIAVELLDGANNEPNFFRFRCNGFGEVTLTFTMKDNSTHEETVTVDIPNYEAVYTQQLRSQDTYIIDQVTYDAEKEMTLWLMQDGGFSYERYPDDFTVMVEPDNGEPIAVNSEKVMCVDEEGRFDLKITLPAGLELDPTENSLAIYYHYGDENQDNFNGITILLPETAQVWRVNLSGGNGVYYENTPVKYREFLSMNFVVDSNNYVSLYYGLENSEKKKVVSVSSSDPDMVSIKVLEGTNNEENFFRLRYHDFGEVELFFTMEDDTTYAENITIDIPGYEGLYTEQNRSQETYVRGALDYDPEEEMTLWLMQDGGFNDTEYPDAFTAMIQPDSGEAIPVSTEKVECTDNENCFDLKITVPTDLGLDPNGNELLIYYHHGLSDENELCSSDINVSSAQTIASPDCALFAQQMIYDEQYRLERINLLALKDNAVWLIHKDGFSQEYSQKISAEWTDNDFDDRKPTAVPVVRADGKYDIKITLPVAKISCQLKVTDAFFSELWDVDIDGTSVQIGKYLIGYGEMSGDETNGYLTINPNDHRRNTNSESTSDARSGLGSWEIYAGTPTNQNEVYDPAPEVGVQINKVWVEVLEGENNLFSWGEAVTPVVTESPDIHGNLCGELYRLNAKEGVGVIFSEITVTIDGQSSTHTIASVMVVEQVASSGGERPENDTVEDLNEYLQKLKAKEAELGEDEKAHYEITLPAITYTGEIIIPAFEKGTLFFYGASGQGTILRGCITLEEGANIHRVHNISFRATPEHGEYAIAGGSGVIADCSFYGYDVAIKSGQNFIRVSGNCAFVNNGIGYLHDSQGKYRNPYGNTSFDECVFINNDTAISLQNWGDTDPDPFNFRVWHSNFIGNGVDFDVQVDATFYFQGNYFGSLAETVTPSTMRRWLDDRQLANVNETRRAAVVSFGNGANVITSPRWRNALDDMWWFDNALIPDLYALRSAAPVAEEENVLICDWETVTQIVDKEAKDLLIDDSAFDLVTEGDKVIYVVDDEENPVATWDFN